MYKIYNNDFIHNHQTFLQKCFCQSEFAFMAVIATRSNFPGSDSPDQAVGKKIRFFCQFSLDNTFVSHNAASATVSFTLQRLLLLSLIFLGQFLQFWNLLT